MCAVLRTNRGRSWWLAVVLALLLGGGPVLRGAAPPPGLTAEQQHRLEERDRLWAEVQALRQKGRLADAVKAAEKMLALERGVFGDVHEDVAGSLSQLARLHLQREDFKAARRAREEVLATRKRLHGEADWRVTDARLELAGVDRVARLGREERSRLAEAEQRNQEVIRLYQQGKYTEAIPIAKEVLAIRKAILSEKHPDYARSLNNLAELHRAMGGHTKALPLYKEARAIFKAALGEKHPDYATSLDSLAVLYKNMGEYAKALPLCEEARAIRKAALGEKHPDYTTSLNNLAALYEDMGEYAKALPLHEEARAIYKATLGEKHRKRPADYVLDGASTLGARPWPLTPESLHANVLVFAARPAPRPGRPRPLATASAAL